MGSKKINYASIFDPFVFNNAPSLSQYLTSESISTSESTIKQYIESVVFDTLKKTALYQLRYMVLSNKFMYFSKEQVFSVFFEQDTFQADRTLLNYDGSSLDGLERFYDQIMVQYQLDVSTELDCIHAVKVYSYVFDTVTLLNRDTDRLNQVLKFIGSKLFITRMMLGEWYTLICGEVSPFPQFSGASWITNEFFCFPSVHQTLAAVTFEHRIYMRRVCLSFMYDIKWKPLLQADQFFFDFMPEYKISHFFQRQAVQHITGTDDYKKRILNRVGTNVFFHEQGHVVMKGKLIFESAAIIKKATILEMTLLESCDECLADCAPSVKDISGLFHYLAKLSDTDVQRATDMLFTYASDTWFFDTNDESMFEYSEMIHLILCRYISPKGILFSKIIQDLDTSNPRSFLTQFITTLNSLVDDLVTLLSKETFVLAGKEKTFKFLSDFSHTEVMEQNPLIDTSTYNYYSFYWAKIFICVDKFIKDRSRLDAFQKKSKRKIYALLFALTTKKKLKPEDAAHYIFEHYQAIMPHYENTLST